MKKVFVGLLSCIVAVNLMSSSTVVLGSDNFNVFGINIEETLPQSMRDNANLTDNQIEYADNQVLVSIKHEYSGLNKRYFNNDFPGVDITEIEYLTPLTDDTENKLLDYDEYKQVLCLHLDSESNKDIFDVMEILEGIHYYHLHLHFQMIPIILIK